MINYNIYKNNCSKEWVTFVHGAGGSSSIWFKQIRDFKKHFNVLLLDLRGHGKSNYKITNTFKKKYTFSSIANDIVDTVQSYKDNPGFLNKSDLSNYTVIERDPVCINYREFNVCGMGPPSSGGVAIAQTLKILEKYDTLPRIT